MQKITPFLWFDGQAEEAANYYVSVFKNAKLGKVARYDDAAAKASGNPKGSVMVAEFELEGMQFVALNGGPHFKFNPAISFLIDCKTQEEIDYYWETLSAVPEAEQCGWLCDKFGVSWQIVSAEVISLFSGPDPVKSGRAMGAMMKMKKIVIADVKRAYESAS